VLTNLSRRELLFAGLAAGSVGSAQASPGSRPQLGVIAHVTAQSSPEQAIAKVNAFGFPTCQIAVGPAPDILLAPQLKTALDKYQVQGTAIMTLGPGRMVWDFYSGPKTIGIVPQATRAARVDALKRASDLAKLAGVPAVHTHCGFIPEDPGAPLYAETVETIRDVASHCKANGQIFLMETGQETPVTMLRGLKMPLPETFK
jgi:L-ribulose-5-phosphate 3-epimerase